MPYLRYSITFQLSTRPHPDGTQSVCVTVTWNRKRYRHTLPVSVPSECWDATAQLARPRPQQRNVAEVNAYIIDTRTRIETLFIDGYPTEKAVEAVFHPSEAVEQGRRTITATIAAFVSEQAKIRSWQRGTVVKFEMLERELHACGLRYLDEIDEHGRRAFFDLHSSHGLRNSTLQKKISILNWFLRWCEEKGIYSERIEKPHLRQIPREVTFLLWDELQHLLHFDYGTHYTLSNVRDIFCLCAFTGLRFSDAEALRWADIQNNSINIVTQKTSDRISIPLNEYAAYIIDRYRPFGLPYVLPRISNQKANAYIKEAALLAGFDREVSQVYFKGSDRCEERQLVFEAITTHWARRSFVVHALRLGIPAEVVIRFTGHKTYTAMKPYVAIVDELKRDYMSRFDDGKSVGNFSDCD